MTPEKNQAFMLFTDQKLSVDYLTDEQAGQIFKAIYTYATDGTMPKFDESLLMSIFMLIKTQIDRSQTAYEKRCRANRANSLKRRNAKASSSQPMASDGNPSTSIATDGNPSHAMEDKNNPYPNNNPNPDDVSNDNIIVEDDDDSFERVWNLYSKPVGSKETLREMWNALSNEDKSSAMAYIPYYVKSRPNPKYRRNLDNFLTMRVWETEPIIDNNNETGKINWTDCQGQPADKRAEHERLAAEAFNSFSEPS